MKMSIVVSENEKTYQLLWYGIPIPSIVLFVYSISMYTYNVNNIWLQSRFTNKNPIAQ